MEDRTADFEIKQILQCLKTNGYELEEIDDSEIIDGNVCATFSKEVPFSEMNGNYVNDSSITVTVDFDRRFDYKNIVEDEEDGTYIYDEDKAYRFITKLMNGTYGEGKGKVKGKGKGKSKRKTRKNRKK
jgi:hypothetical protein